MDAGVTPDIEAGPLPARGSRRISQQRLAGAALGSVLCGGLLVALYAAAAIPAIEGLVRVRYVLGPDGFMPDGTLPHLAAWACGPVAAALAGVLLAGAAVRGERWAGPWMGVVTFLLTLLLASLIPDLTRLARGQASFGEAIGQAVVGAPLMTLLAGALLAPLGAVCAAAGTAWAWVLRRGFTGSGRATRSTMLAGSAGLLLAVLFGGLLLSWLALAPLLGSLSEGTVVD